MTRSTRFLVLSAVAALSALLAAGAALAAYSPRLYANSNELAATITFKQAATDDASAKIVIYSPINYVADLGDVGFPVGKATLKANLADSGNSSVTMTGTIDPITNTDTVTFGGVTAPYTTHSRTCTGVTAHTGWWQINATSGSQSLKIPVYIDSVPPTSLIADRAWFVYTICLGSPTLATGAAGRIELGAKITELSLWLEGTGAAEPGWHPWALVATPYTATSTANTTATTEVQSFDRSHPGITLLAKRTPDGIRVTGQLKAGGNGKGLNGQTITITQGTKTLGSAKTGPAGTFKATLKTTSSAPVKASATVADQDTATSCLSLFGAPICIAQTRGGFTTTTPATKLS